FRVGICRICVSNCHLQQAARKSNTGCRTCSQCHHQTTRRYVPAPVPFFIWQKGESANNNLKLNPHSLCHFLWLMRSILSDCVPCILEDLSSFRAFLLK